MAANKIEILNKNMKDIIICVGISGSGKSTWSSNFIKENSNYLRCNRDDIRKVLVGDLNYYYQRKDLNSIEVLVNKIEDDLFFSICDTNKSIIIDNTNLKQSYINKWINFCRSMDYVLDFKFKLFDSSLEESQRRVAKRENMQTFEDLNYIDKQFKDYQLIKEWIIKNYKDKIIK